MAEKFYESINDYYDYIFALNSSQVEFVKSEFPNKNSKLMEVGCANGKLTNALSSYKISGIDLEKSFIDEALRRYPKIDFSTLNMLDIDKLDESFDGIICFGNTLVHIDELQIAEFLYKAYNKLNKGGKIAIQILNYDYILDNNITSLPLIENKYVKFERYYDHKSPFIFNTKLTIKTENRVIDNSVILTPIKKDRLVELMQIAGFGEISLYGNFIKHPLSKQSLPLILSGHKS